MDKKKIVYRSVDDYIAGVPLEVQERLEQIRATIKGAAPDAVEKISYGMPAYAYKGNLVYFGAWTKHIGFYPASGEASAAFAQELLEYEVTKGTIKLPHNKPLPLDTIRKIVEFRLAQNQNKSKKNK